MAETPAFWDLPLALSGSIAEDRSSFLRVHAVPENAPSNGLHGTVLIIHGGYWKNKYGLDDEYGNAGVISLAPFFLRCGFGAIEVEYRRRDHEGGGWPGTNDDILTAMRLVGELHAAAGASAAALQDALPAATADPRCMAALQKLRPDRLILAGHSAGGCMALWGGHRCPPNVKVAAVLALAPVADLVLGHELRVSDEGDAVELYMKCKPDDEEGRERYAQASPAVLLPVTFPTVVAYGDADSHVPPELVSSYAKSASTGAPDLVREVCVPGIDHFDVVNAGSDAWKGHIVPALAALLETHLGAEVASALRQGVA
mmetsp:Transcript_90200/g.291601  ORF Transcript_90200/g.291601 Transcript_90200/m.291601 type:complete len:315 (-) Transcript_90200:61-1005(-)